MTAAVEYLPPKGGENSDTGQTIPELAGILEKGHFSMVDG